MLKIKDNVELDKLLEYGFELDLENEIYCKILKDNEIWIVDIENRIISLQTGFYVSRELEDLYNLIKNDLVEEVKQ